MHLSQDHATHYLRLLRLYHEAATILNRDWVDLEGQKIAHMDMERLYANRADIRVMCCRVHATPDPRHAVRCHAVLCHDAMPHCTLWPARALALQSGEYAPAMNRNYMSILDRQCMHLRLIRGGLFVYDDYFEVPVFADAGVKACLPRG